MTEKTPSEQSEKYQKVVDLLTAFNSTGELSKLSPESSDEEMQIVLEGEARQIRAALQLSELTQDTERAEKLRQKLEQLENLRDEIAGINRHDKE